MKKALGDRSIHSRQTPPATGSEPVSLGSNPSSPVFISHAPRGFRHAGAGLPRERGWAVAGALQAFEPPPLYGGIRAQPGFVAVSRFDLSFFSHAPRGFRHSGAGGAAGASRGPGSHGFPADLPVLGVFRPAGGTTRQLSTNLHRMSRLLAFWGDQCQRRSQPRRQKNHISPPVVASMIAIATNAP